MKNQKRFVLGMFTMLLFASLQVAVLGQEAKVANVRAEGMGVRFDSAIPYSNATLTVSGPDGTVYRGHDRNHPYMQEVVPITLVQGSRSEFDKACAAVKPNSLLARCQSMYRTWPPTEYSLTSPQTRTGRRPDSAAGPARSG